jgi:hypothetical protein
LNPTTALASEWRLPCHRDGRCVVCYSTHDFIEVLRALPLDLERLQYAEGGPEAQLYVAAGGRELELFGSIETGFFDDDGNQQAWPVPNVIGVKRR